MNARSSQTLMSAPDAPRTSISISAEIDRLRSDLTLGEARLVELAGDYDRAILAGDKEAEANERETTVTKRGIRRAELRLEELDVELETARSREKESQLQLKRDEANAAVEAVLAKLDKGYREPSRLIAAFLAEYVQADALAIAAGVPSPHQRTRLVAGYRVPDRMEDRKFYIDEHGNETSSEFPAGSYRVVEGVKLDAMGHPLRPRAMRMRQVKVDGNWVPASDLGPLYQKVTLPRTTMNEAGIWPVEKEAT